MSLYIFDILLWLWPDHIQWQHPTDQTLYRTRPFTEFWVVSIEYLRRVWHADRGRFLLRTPGPVPLGLAYILLVETNPFPNLSLFYRTMLFEYPSVLSRFSIILLQWWFFNQGSDSPEISLVRTKSAGTDFRVRTNGRIINPENSLIRKNRPGTNVSGLTNHHCIYVCVQHFYDLSALVGCWYSFYIRKSIYNF